jgi:hypothetical protein
MNTLVLALIALLLIVVVKPNPPMSVEGGAAPLALILVAP